MEDKKTFEISLIKKIPYLTSGLLLLFCISFFCLTVLFGIFSDEYATPETNFYYLICMPINSIILYFIVSLIITSFLYLLARFKRKGLIVFNNDSFELILKKERHSFLLPDIRRVYCNDSEDRNGSPNKKFTMTIETWKNKKILIRLQNPKKIKQFIDKLLSYDQIKIEYFSVTTLD